MPQSTFIAARQEWQEAWLVTAFRRRVMTGLGIFIGMASLFPRFFQAIERRHGTVLNDPVLRMLPPHNVSVPIFIVIWSFTAYCVFREAQTPRIFLAYLWSFIFLCAFRTVTIMLVPLDPPVGLIGLGDPISNFFYGGTDKFVTKDLFFSGHTSSVFLLYFILPGKTDKRLAFIVTVTVGILLLVQHVHYMLDVLGALLFSWLSYQIALRVVLRKSAT